MFSKDIDQSVPVSWKLRMLPVGLGIPSLGLSHSGFRVAVVSTSSMHFRKS